MNVGICCRIVEEEFSIGGVGVSCLYSGVGWCRAQSDLVNSPHMGRCRGVGAEYDEDEDLRNSKSMLRFFILRCEEKQKV